MDNIGLIIRELRTREKLTQKELAGKLKLSPQQISRYENGDDEPLIETIHSLAKIFKVDVSYLLGGKKLSQGADKVPGIPVYSIDASASNVEMYNDTINEPPAFYITMKDYADCDFGARVYGDSMYPEIHSGDYIICKKIDNGFSLIQFGETYLIVTKDNQRMVKRLRKTLDKEFVLCESRNKDSYDDFEIPRESIHTLYLVKGIIKRKGI
jgi:transcriptional regulator with XRE-family HTH domain